MIEIAAAAGFPSNTSSRPLSDGKSRNPDLGVVPYLIDRIERKRYVLLALMRFKNAVHAHDAPRRRRSPRLKNITLAHPLYPTHPASPARPNDARRGCWDCAPAATRRGSVTGSAKSTAGKKHKVAFKRAREHKKLD